VSTPEGSDAPGTCQKICARVASTESAHSQCCLLPAPQAMDRHVLALERKPEAARVVMDGVAPALRLLQGLLAPPTLADVPAQQTKSTSAPFGGVQDACCCYGLGGMS
jgi:hypothetical protein